jgi:hypothetical protein
VEFPGSEMRLGMEIQYGRCTMESPGTSLGKDTSVAFEICCEAVLENQVPLTFLKVSET